MLDLLIKSLLGGAGLLFAFWGFLKAKKSAQVIYAILSSSPTGINDLEPGTIEVLKGTAHPHPDSPRLTSPVSKTECLAYHLMPRNTTRIIDKTSGNNYAVGTRFRLQCGFRELPVEPRISPEDGGIPGQIGYSLSFGGTILDDHDLQIKGHEQHPLDFSDPQVEELFSVFPRKRRYDSCLERRIQSGDDVWVIGTVDTDENGDLEIRNRFGHPFYVSNQSPSKILLSNVFALLSIGFLWAICFGMIHGALIL